MKNILLSLALLGAVTAATAATTEQVVVRQRWPWSAKVDIDFVLSGTDAIGFAVEASYDGSDGWVALGKAALSGDLDNAEPGDHHVEWNPAASGLTQCVTNLQVRVIPYTFDSRKYLVVDIKNGTYEYMSEPPANGWSAADGYMSSKMAFRRIPAGTYTIGHPKADLSPFYSGHSSWYPQFLDCMGQRQVTMSSDYYIAVYPTTTGQMYHIHGYSDHHEQSVYNGYNYQGLRGTNWPADRFSVAGSSEAGLFRSRLGGELLIDLPTATQYEVAMRAGTTTIFPNGGSGSDSLADLKSNYYLKMSAEQTENVGLRDPNDWGIYNPLGMYWYVVLDAISASGDRESVTGQNYINFAENGTDPIGHAVSDPSDRMRMTMGGGWYSSNWSTMTGWRMAVGESAANGAARFCIHLDSSIAD